MNEKWQIGDLMCFEGRDGMVYGIIISRGGHNKKRFRILWFDDDLASDEDPKSDNNRIRKIS